MNCWIDADACPGVVTDLIIKSALRYEVRVTFVANQPVRIPNHELFQSVQVEAGPDVADRYIEDHAEKGDLVVTQDIPLGAALVSKGVVVINTHGHVLDQHNAANRLATRDILQGMRDAGQVTGGPKPFGPKDRERMANSLDKWLSYLKREKEREKLRNR